MRLDSIGDYVLFRNYIEVLKTSIKYKNYKITLCGNSWWRELAEKLDSNYIDTFIWVDYTKIPNNSYRFNLHKKIFLSGFEVLIHPTYSRDVISDEIVKYSGAKEKIGYEGDTINISLLQKQKNSISYTTLIPPKSKFEFEFYRNRDFFEQLLNQKITLLKPQISHSEDICNKIIFFPGAKDSFRRWSTKNYAQLAALLKSEHQNTEFLICGALQDKPLAKEMMDNSTINFTDLTGALNLMQLIDVLLNAKLVVTNDSGPFHIATALNKKVVCISNGNNYGRFTPYPEEMKTKSVVVYPTKITVYPEQERLEYFCKEVKDIDINEITVEQVYSQINKLLNN
ncbi:MAG: glycosyltransferase family 9 protein [Bacteroidia bacterium]